MIRQEQQSHTKNSPTVKNYTTINEAYNFFNRQLFDGILPGCLITLQRQYGSYGYFAQDRFVAADKQNVTDEIALNPSHFNDHSAEQVLSTLVHEMAHLWQHHYGKTSRPGYHNREWAAKMREFGLIPSSTGEEGGNETGQKMSHYIATGGKFANHCANLLKSGFEVPYVQLWDEAKAQKSKRHNKTKFTCPVCEANAWGKPELKIICADCEEIMNAG